MPPATDGTRPAPFKGAALVLAALLGATVVLSSCSLSGAAGQGALPQAASVVGQPGGQGSTTSAAATSMITNPGNGKPEAVIPEIGRTVLLIGDSQSEPADGWPRLGLAAAGYNVYFCGRGGTGYVAANGATGNYIDALQRGDWALPAGTPALIVLEGGGNDASNGASDAQITRNAERLIAELRTRYPGTRMAMIGTLARGANDGGGRRSEVDALLGGVAAANGLPFVSVGDWLTRYGLAKDLADAVHMNTEGRTALGGILARRLRELGLGRTPVVNQRPLAAVSDTSSALQD